MDGTTAASNAVSKLLSWMWFRATTNGITADHIPSKIEGIAIGPMSSREHSTLHTLWVANDNDFLLVPRTPPSAIPTSSSSSASPTPTCLASYPTKSCKV